ncbi:hypothetical protein A6R71_11430 [Xanthomonas translucens pv. arrhenatheri]|uniref:Putative membrane protein n=1 Tax=Xanthomonas graminis pv. arrhenatheri LMG 727 TaxID=1195923 RepID=A0A0K2ZGK8_9XANT|nr:hypothetical protein [Xanthomonas translucens]OAX64423.1 hypothetical protein A6R71_11430 [Xanthomonas translucens pv. arrhenatheri]UKE78985.1 hypothetical protein KM317_07115 [Xanthomonas translucens pv. arrhenatheri]CTP84901.1 putative membrane protein [Xanthomonas translucens pv. arrhenatheri LMG 727]
MNSHARNRMPTLAALLLIALLALIAASRPAAATLAPALTDSGLLAAPELPAADAQAESRDIADPLDDYDSAVVPPAPWRQAHLTTSGWPEPAAWRGAGTHPQPRLRPPSA